MAGEVEITLPDGALATVPEQDLQQALQAGARVTQEFERERAAADTAQGKALAFVTAADENTFGLGTELGLQAVEALDGQAAADQTARDIRRDREANQGYATAGGVLGGLALGGGTGLGLSAETTLGRIGVTALEGATQGAMSGAGHALTEQALGNPEANAESYFADQIASGFLLGGVVGGGLGGLGELARRAPKLRSNARQLGELGAEVTGDAASGRQLIEGYRGAETAVDDIVKLGKYTSAEARKVVSDVEELAKKSLSDKTVAGVADRYIGQIAGTDPEMARVLRTQFESGSQLASKFEGELDTMARDLATRGDKMLKVEQTLYDESITAKGAQMAKLVDPEKVVEASDAAVGMIRNARAFADDAEGLMGGAGLSRSMREEADRFEQIISGRARQANAAETRATEKLTKAQDVLTEAEQRVQAAEERIAKAAKEGPAPRGEGAAGIRELESSKKALAAAQEKVNSLQALAQEAAKSAIPEAAPKAVTASDIFMAADNFKRNVGKLKGMATGPRVEQRIANRFEELYEGSLRMPLEDAAVWGDAAASAQREVNEAWTSRLNTRNDLGRSFLRDFGRDPGLTGGAAEVADAGKFRGFLANISAPGKDLDRKALDQWLDGAEHAMAQTEKHYGSVPAYAEGRKAIAEMRDTLAKAEAKAKTIEALQARKLSEGDGLGGALGLVSDVFVRPLKTAERLASVKAAVDKVDNATKRVVEGLFGTAKQRAEGFVEGAKATLASSKADREAVKKSAESVRKLAAAPEGFMASLSKRLEGLSSAAPEHARAIGTVASRAMAHLAQHAPAGRRSSAPLRSDGELRFNDTEIDAFARRLRVVEDPLSVVRDAERGKITLEQMDTLKKVYPSIYEGIRNRAWDQIQKLKQSGKIDEMPYAKRLSVGILLDLASDETMEPGFIAMIQQSKAVQTNQPAQQAPQKAPAQNRGVPRRVEIDRSALTTESARIEGGPS